MSDEPRKFGTDPLVRSAARWVVHELGLPFNMTTEHPPPPALRQAIYEVVYEDRDGDLHGNQLTFEEVVTWVDDESHWPAVEWVRDSATQENSADAVAKDDPRDCRWDDCGYEHFTMREYDPT